jgi:hypothetical protein
MKRLVIATFLPLLISQGVALAQADSQNPAEPENSPVPQAATTVKDQPQSPIMPLKGTEQIQLRLVNCSWGVDCLLANVLLPASARLNQLELKFDNPAPQPATILNSAVVVQGNLTQYPLPNGALAIPNQELSLPAQQISGIPLNLDRSAMPPEQYVGAIYLTQANQSNRLVLPVNLSVRSGPLGPIVVLLLGVLLGRLFKYMQEQGGPQVQARKQVYQLEADLREAHPADRKILLPMVRETRQLVYRHQLEAVDTQVTLIQSRRLVLKQLRAIEDQLYERQKRHEPITPEDLLEQLQSARDLIAQGQDDQAKTALDQILEAASARPRGAAAADLEELESALRGASVNLTKSARRVVTEVETVTPLAWTDQLQQFLVSLAGLTDLVRAETTFWFVRPTLYLVLLTGLTLVGLNTLYIEKGETFGARPMADYLVLLFWGLSADVASRSLSTLQGERE